MSDDMRVPFGGDRRAADERNAAAAVAAIGRMHRRTEMARRTDAVRKGRGLAAGMPMPPTSPVEVPGDLAAVLKQVEQLEASGRVADVEAAKDVRARLAGQLFSGLVAARQADRVVAVTKSQQTTRAAEAEAAVRRFQAQIARRANAAIERVNQVRKASGNGSDALMSAAKSAIGTIGQLTEQVRAIADNPAVGTYGISLESMLDSLDNGITALARLAVAPPDGHADLQPAPPAVAGVPAARVATPAAPVAKARRAPTVVHEDGRHRVLSDGRQQIRTNGKWVPWLSSKPAARQPIAKSQPPADTVQFRLFER